MQEDRLHQIDVANTHLVDRMVSIAEGKGSLDSRLRLDPSLSIPVSMNIKKRVEEVDRIARENWLIKKRLDKVTGSYSEEFPEGKTRAKKRNSQQDGERRKPSRPSAMSPTPRGGRKRMANNFLPLFTIGTRLGDLHVKMNIYDKRDGSVRIMIYEPLSSRQYPMDLDKDLMSRIVGEEGADLLTSKSPEAKLMWKNFASQLTLKPVADDQPHVFKLVVDTPHQDDTDPFHIMETEFEFADPTKVHEPHKYDAAIKIQARFRGSSGRKLVAELEVRKRNQTGRKKKTKGSPKNWKKTPEKKFAEKAEIEMIETYQAQSVIAKHVKGHLARKQTMEIKRARTASDQSATLIQAAIRKKKAKAIAKEKKEQKEASVKLQGMMRKRKATQIVQKKKKQKDASVKLQGMVRKKKAKAVVKEKKDQKDASVKLQGLVRKKKAKAVVKEKKDQKDASMKLQGMVRQKKARETIAKKGAESEEINLGRLQEEHREAKKVKRQAQKAERERFEFEEAEAEAKRREEEDIKRKKEEEEAAAAAAAEKERLRLKEEKEAEETKAKAKEVEAAAAAKVAEAAAAAAEAEEKEKERLRLEKEANDKAAAGAAQAEAVHKLAEASVASEVTTAIADVSKMVEEGSKVEEGAKVEEEKKDGEEEDFKSIVHGIAEGLVEGAIREGTPTHG